MKNSEKISVDKLFNFRPIFFTAIALCFGIVFGYLRKFYDVSAWWLCILSPIAVASFLFCPTKKEIVRAACTWLSMLVFFSLGQTIFYRQTRNFENATAYNGEGYVVGRVTEKTEYDYIARLVLDDISVDGKREEGKLNAYLPLSFYNDVELCDEVLLYGTLTTETDFFDEHGFRSYVIGEDLRYEIRVDFCLVSDKDFELFTFLRARMQSRIYAGMDDDAAAVMTAVLTGDTTGISADLLDNMRYGGIAHIFAVSGLHVGALYAFCLLLLDKTSLKKLPKVGRFFLLATLLFLYGGICGFSASIVRAITLCLVGYATKLFASSLDFLGTLGLSAIVILFLSPVSLFDVGFQLSFAACLGIALLQKRIGQVCVEIGKVYRKAFPRKLTPQQQKTIEKGDTLPPTVGERVAHFFASTFSVSLAAQIATAPICLARFGYVSGWAIALNLFFVPIVSAAFAFLLLCVFIACCLPVSASVVVLYAPNVIWSFALLLFEAVDFSGFALTGWRVSLQSYICYYGGCLFLTDKWNFSAALRKIIAFAFFFAFIFFFLAGNLRA